MCGAGYKPSDLFRRAKRYPCDKPRSRCSTLTLFDYRLSRQVEPSVACEHSISSTTLDFLFLTLLAQSLSLSSTRYRGPISRPLASHIFRPYFEHSYVLEEKHVCWWIYCVGHATVSKALSDYNLRSKEEILLRSPSTRQVCSAGGVLCLHFRAARGSPLRLYV